MRRFFIKRPHNSSTNTQNTQSTKSMQNSQDIQHGMKDIQQSQTDQNTRNIQQSQGQPGQNAQQSQNSQPGQNAQQTQNSQPVQNMQQSQNSQPGQNMQQSQNSQSEQNSQQPQNGQNTQNVQPTQTNQTGQNANQTQNAPSLLNTLKNQNAQSIQNAQTNQNLLNTLKNQNTPNLLNTLKNQNVQSVQDTQTNQNLLNTLKAQNIQNTPNTPNTQNTQNLLNTLKFQNGQNNSQIPIQISPTLTQNVENIKQKLGQPSDLVIRDFTVGALEVNCCIVHISGLTDPELVNNNILKAVQTNTKQFNANLLDKIFQEVIAITGTKKLTTIDELLDAVLAGNAVFLLDGETTVLAMEAAGGEQRAIDEPNAENVIRGSRTGFVENIGTNMTLVRREIKDPNLRFKMHSVGSRSKQKIAISYVEGIANPEIVEEVTRRIQTIDIDYAPDSGFVEQWIEDSFLSPLPQLIDTERPDRVAYLMLQGKVAILVEGSPSALVAPITIGEAIRTVEDYSQRWMIGTVLRLLRYLAIYIALFLPALYVALVAYHPGMIPTKIAFSIAATREGVPFPSIIEALLMAVTFEILQEAGIRLPKAIGQTVGIVGGIVIGDVAVSAGIVSPAMVIVTSLTAIASFTLPNYSVAVALRVMRFALILAASVLGMFGIILVFIMLCIHVVNLKSMGTPYSSQFAPHFLGDLKNILIRAPIMALKERPAYLRTEDEKKMNDGS